MYFIIGASGFIGKHLYNYCKRNKIDVIGTYYRNPYCSEWVRFDLCTDYLYDLICRYLERGEPKEHVVIICGANSNIDSCKKNEDASYCLNVLGTKRILEQANELGVKSVFLSSEAVFDGRRGMYTEKDIPAPITVYGRQKLQIEQYMIHNMTNYLIFRISRAVGSRYGEKDIFDEFYHKMIRNEDIVCLKNQSFCLTEIHDIIKGIIEALEQELSGLYHLSSANYISRFELADLYAKKIFGSYEKIVEKEFDEISFLDNRHIYGGLNGEKLSDLLGIQYMKTHEILNRYSSTMQKEISV